MSRYIDADAFLAHMKKTPRYFHFLGDIEEFPSADVEHVSHGHWIVHERAEAVFGLIIPNFECSECHTLVRPDGRGKRCLECGAKMDRNEKEPVKHKFLTAEQVNKFTPDEIRANYTDILLSMPKWGKGNRK